VIASLPEADLVHKISIISRGMAAGYTIALPDDDHSLTSRKKDHGRNDGLLGGRAAEELIFNDITPVLPMTLKNVTKLARKMVTRLGMSADLGPMVYGRKTNLFLRA
jgi:cell division protease FtsH